MELSKEKYTGAYEACGNTIAIRADHRKIEQFILEHIDKLVYKCAGHGDPGCIC